MPKPLRTNFVLKGVNAIQMILAPKKRTTIPFTSLLDDAEGTDMIPQTILPIEDTEENEIPISELLHEKSKRASYYIDPRKMQHKLWGVMIDVTENGSLPISTSKSCWWCRSPFHSLPIGCPLKYSSPTTTSPIDRQRMADKLTAANFPPTPIEKLDFFETEGYFCSFPCCKAYIISQRSSIKYKDSAALLGLLYTTIYGSKASFPTAPSWKILKEYGGHLTIQEFRMTFGQLEYNETINIRRPYMFATAQFISEKRIKLFRGIKE